MWGNGSPCIWCATVGTRSGLPHARQDPRRYTRDISTDTPSDGQEAQRSNVNGTLGAVIQD